MSEPISIQQLKDASEDAISLADFINKPENVMIPRRLASDINSLQHYLEYMKSFAQRSYETYDEMVVNASNLSENVSVFVTNDSDTSKNGIYTYNGESFVKGEYQPENAAKEFVESKLGGLEVVDGKVRAQYVSTADGSTQEVKNAEFRNELDALPFEDGVLADTFVTMTKKSPEFIARTLSDVNAEKTSIKDFGQPVGDDWTEVIHKAISYGKPVHFPAGTYKLRKDAFVCKDKTILFYGDKGADLVIIEGSSTLACLTFPGNGRVVINGFNIYAGTDSESNVLMYFNSPSYTSELNLNHNNISGYVEYANGSGSTTLDPNVTPFGFGSIEVKYNNIKNSHDGLINFSNFPVKLMDVSNNTVRNFGGKLFSCGIANGADNEDKLSLSSEFIAQNNVVTTDTDYWSTSTGVYITFLLCEGFKATWSNNVIDGLKTRELVSLCDSYLSTRIVERSNNRIRNIGNFSDHFARNIFFLKGEAVLGVIPKKTIINDHFIIDDAWLAAIGEEDCSYRLANFGHTNGGSITFRDCVVKVPTLISNHNNRAQNFTTIGNKFEIGKVESLEEGSNVFSFWNFGMVVDAEPLNGYIDIQNESVVIHNCDGVSCYFMYNPSTPFPLEYLNISGNSFSFYNASRLNVMLYHDAKRASISNNSILGLLHREYYFCMFDQLDSFGNVFSNIGGTTGPSGTEGGMLRTLEYPCIGKTGSLHHKYLFKAQNYQPNIFGRQDSGVQRVLVKYLFKTEDGEDTISYLLKIDNTLGSKKVTFSTPEGVVTTLAHTTDAITPVALKSKITSDSAITPSYSLQIASNQGEMHVALLGVTNVTAFEVFLDVLQIS